MPYSFQSSDAYQFARTQNIQTKKLGSELQFLSCPFCHGGVHKDQYTFAINLHSGAYNCKRASCKQSGSFIRLAAEFGLELEDGYQKKYRQLPPQNYTDLFRNQQAYKFLEARGISAAVSERYKVTMRKDNLNILVIPFYDENGDLQFIKYRNTRYKKGVSAGHKEWCEKNCKPILFGMAQCSANRDQIVITEGQIDALSLIEAGIENAVSVPTGALGFTWIEFCFDWLMQFQEIIVMGDNEHGKITLVDQLSQRLPKRIKVVRRIDYLGEKDANDILLKHGRESLLTAIQNAQPIKVDAVIELADVEEVDLTELPKVSTGIQNLNRIIGGFYFGQVFLMTGKRGQGKSTVCSQFFAEAINQGFNAFAYSGELPNYHFKRWLDFQLLGKSHLDAFPTNFEGEFYYKPKPGYVYRVSEWYRGKAYIYDNTQTGEDSPRLLQTLERAICIYQIKFILLDNLMTAVSAPTTEKQYLEQGNFVKALKAMAMKYNVAILLVAHPRKNSGGGVPQDCDDVSGSSQITDRVDVVMNYKSENNTGELSVLKNRLNGRLAVKDNAIQLEYCSASKRIYTTGTNPDWKYDWENTIITDQNYTAEEAIENGWDLPF